MPTIGTIRAFVAGGCEMIFCDEINLLSFLKILKHGSNKDQKEKTVFWLDRLPEGFWEGMLVVALKGLGFRFERTEFCAGQMRSKDGESIVSKTIRSSTDLAFGYSRQVLEESFFLKDLNQRRGKETIRKVIAQSVFKPIAQVVVRGLATQHLSDIQKIPKAILIVKGHHALRRLDWNSGGVRTPIDFYTPYWDFRRRRLHFATAKGEWLKRTVLGQILKWILVVLKEWLTMMKGNPSELPPLAGDNPGLLLIQDEEISLDHSIRTQPHWDTTDCPYQILILEDPFFAKANAQLSREELKTKNIHLFRWNPPTEFSQSASPLRGGLKEDRHHAMGRLLSGTLREKFVIGPVLEILQRAIALEPLCRDGRIKAFITCENYKPDADAMRLLADDLKIVTLSFQYSNLGVSIPSMSTTAHVMMAFSPLFHPIWRHHGLGPDRMVDGGYVYASAKEKVQPRSRALRQRLQNQGVSFVLCYFDENCLDDPFTFMTISQQMEDLERLYRLVCETKDAGLVVKTQFQYNLPENFPPLKTWRDKALQTGRYVELSSGHHRNVIFPMEAAMAADVAIGYNFGATASLEAAIAGVRSILIDQGGYRGIQDSLYRKGDIIFRSLDEGLKAIQQYRAGQRSNLGDWSGMIKQFDAFGDYRSTERLKDELGLAMRKIDDESGSSHLAPRA